MFSFISLVSATAPYENSTNAVSVSEKYFIFIFSLKIEVSYLD